MKKKNNITEYAKKIFQNLGKNIQIKRTEKNITLKELSKKTGIHEQYLKKIEKGEAIGITTKHLSEIINILNTKPSDLFKENN